MCSSAAPPTKFNTGLTHTLRPETDELRLRRCPGAREHGVQRAREALNDAKSGDTCSHGPERGRGERSRGQMANGHYRRDNERELEKMCS